MSVWIPEVGDVVECNRPGTIGYERTMVLSVYCCGMIDSSPVYRITVFDGDVNQTEDWYTHADWGLLFSNIYRPYKGGK